ncbi:hypothetical protein QUF54_11000 [Candidatus Marithioploca araucensis]|uniref:Uncharacterized protein n=1 Tax=Candidatus Marithioploca araucensis TaxID=70273 RepID=A0ABT7VWB5_9GAMM|nr:hypothetical protein [Candidatus Marithioploca araucensis]
MSTPLPEANPTRLPDYLAGMNGGQTLISIIKSISLCLPTLPDWFSRVGWAKRVFVLPTDAKNGGQRGCPPTRLT